MAAGTSIFTLMGSILIDNDKANESIKKTEGHAEGLAGKLGKGIGTAAKWGAAIGGAAIAGGAALFGMASKASDAGDRIDKMSQKIGVSSTAFQEFDYILGQNGTDVEKLQVGLKTLVQRMDESTQGTGKGAEAFSKLGLSATDAAGQLKSQEVMFEETAKAMMALPEGAEKSQLAFELFGKAGLELMPMLNGTAEDMDMLKARAHELGFVMDEESVKAAAAFNDSMDDIKKAMGGAITKIGIELMPMFQSMMDWVMAHMPEIQAVIKKAFEVVADVVNVAIDIFTNYLLPIFVAIFEWVQENWPTISAIIKTAFKVIETVWNNVLSPVLGFLWDGLKKVTDFVSDNFPAFQSTVENVMSGIKTAVGFVVDVFDTLADGIKWALDKWNEWRNRPEDKKTPSTSSNPTKFLNDYTYKPAKNARGTENFGGGWSWVGEEGPELMQLPKGTKIRSNEKSMDMVNSENIIKGLGKEIADALVNAGLSKPVTIQIDGKKVGESIIKVIDKGLNDRYNDGMLAKGMV